MNNWLIPFVIIFAWSICDLQDASENIRIVRSSDNYSRFVHHNEEEKDFATPEPSESNTCFEDSVNASTDSIEETTDGHRKRRGQEYVTTISQKYDNNFMKIMGFSRRRRNDEIRTKTNEYRKKFSDDLSDKIKIGRVVRIKHNGIVTEAPSENGEFIENIRADRLKGRRRHYNKINTDVTDRYSDELLNCDLIDIEMENFEKLSNGSVYVPEYGRLFGPRDYYQNEDGVIFVCPKFFEDFDAGNYTEPTIEIEDMFSKEFINCDHISIEKAHFEKLPNKSVYFPVYKKLVTPRDYHQTEDGVIFVCPKFFEDFDAHNYTEITPEVEDMYSEEFISCAHTAIEKGCFEIHPNGSVYVPLYKRLFTEGNYYKNEHGVIFVCPVFFEEIDTTTDKFPRAIYIVTLIGTVVSTLCVVVHIVMFLLLEKLRNLPGYCLFSMCIALMVAYICTFIPYARKEVADCTAVGVIKAYGFLASFFWMNVMAYDIWRSLRLATAKLRLSGQRLMMARFAMYSAYSWGCPLVIIIIGFIVNSSENSIVEYRLEITDDRCWFKYKQANLVYFASPLFTMIILNVLLFVSSFVMISSATMNTAENKADLWSRFLVSFRLAVVMGLMWIFGVLATATEAQWLWYFFVICNVLQGVFIFFSFTFTEKTRKEARKALTTKKNSLDEETGIFRCQTRYMRQKD